VSGVAEPNVYCVVLARNDDLSHEDFVEIWTREHRQLVDELPGLVGVQLLPVAEPMAGGPDGVGLLYFSNGADMKAALSSSAAQRLRDHTPTFAKSAEATRLLLIAGAP
jgi:EthD domain